MNMTQAPPAVAPVLLEVRHDSIVTLTMNRPDRLNALNNSLTKALLEALSRISNDHSVHVVVLTGAGRAFCAGGDLGAIGKGREKGDAAELAPLLRSGMQAVLKMRTMPQPVIAVINGAAAGAGMNLALAADIRFASEDAAMGQNFAKVGLFPDYGGTFFLPELIGPSRAAEMFYTGEMIDANKALSLGLVNHIYPQAQLEAEANAFAQKIANGPQVVIRDIKQAVFARCEKALHVALEREVEHQLQCFHSRDCSEGIRAFMEKRQPKFEGR